tara:strand:+ start:139 stop:753 length:615 start_codon:yes stop_codon:yes gene_type:complete
MSKKPIIVFEGIEGSGKSYHINNVVKFLKRKKYSFIKLREPGGSKNSELIRKLILNNKSNFTANTDLLLYLAARSENLSILRKNYNKKIILIDRFVDSTIAYQHYGLGVDLDFIKSINNFLLKDIKISFTFLNIVNYENMKLRLKKRFKLNRYDQFNDQFYKKVQNGFIKLSKIKPSNYMIVNSNLNINENKKIIINKLSKIIK